VNNRRNRPSGIGRGLTSPSEPRHQEQHQKVLVGKRYNGQEKAQQVQKKHKRRRREHRRPESLATALVMSAFETKRRSPFALNLRNKATRYQASSFNKPPALPPLRSDGERQATHWH
jgi:hypothetical protein